MAVTLKGSSYGTPNFFFPLVNVTPEALGLTPTNADIVFTDDPDNSGAYKSHRLGRANNDFNECEAYKLYFVIMKQDLPVDNISRVGSISNSNIPFKLL